MNQDTLTICQILEKAGLQPRATGQCVIVPVAAAGAATLALGLRYADGRLAIGMIWPTPVRTRSVEALQSLVAVLNRRLPMGEWDVDVRARSLTLRSSAPLDLQDAHFAGRLVSLVRLHGMLVIEAAQGILSVLCGDSDPDAAAETARMAWCQPQLESLPQDEQVSAEEWEATVRAIG